MRNLLSIITLAVALVMVPACKSPGRGVHATMTAITQTADQYMDDFAEDVRLSRISFEDGGPRLVSLDRERAVKAAWEAYTKALIGARVASQAYHAATKEEKDDAMDKLKAAVGVLEDNFQDLAKLFQ